MLTIKDGKKILTTPVSAEDLKDIHIGDVVYLNGDLTTCRDVAHRRLVEEGRPLPVDVKDAAIFHAGPIIRLPVTPLWLPPRWRRSSRPSGVTSVCRKLCGTATLRSLAP